MISIIIATFNASRYIQRCLNSIASQFDSNVEVIIIDGGSTDKTVEIINDNSNIVKFWISEPDCGIYDAWNKGVSNAKYNWVMFIGADDVLLPNSISKLIKIATEENRNKFDLLCFKNELVDNDNQLIKIIGEDFVWRRFRKTNTIAHVASLHNKSTLFKENIYDTNYKISSDYDLLLSKGNSLRVLFTDICIARMKAGGISYSLNAILETFRIRKCRKSVSYFFNVMLLFFDIMVFYSFKIKTSIKGFKY